MADNTCPTCQSEMGKFYHKNTKPPKDWPLWCQLCGTLKTGNKARVPLWRQPEEEKEIEKHEPLQP